ncbi:MAG TPA: cellulase family glycosylhydrolase [Marinagarivorans sp.]
MIHKSTWRCGKSIAHSALLASAIATLAGCVGTTGSSSSDDNTGQNSSTNAISSTATQSSSPSQTSSTATTSSTPTTTSSQTTTSSAGTASSSAPFTPPQSGTNGIFRVKDGVVMKNGQPLDVRCGNWFGLEGQHEPQDAEHPGAAPLELYIGNMWWKETGRNMSLTMQEIKRMGINTVRLPITPQTLDPNYEEGRGYAQQGGYLKNDPANYPYDNAYEAMLAFLDEANSQDVNVMLDIHSCSNYVGWRAGRLDAHPPYADADRPGYDFQREDRSCASGNEPGITYQTYGKTRWLEDIRTLATLARDYRNVIGIDIFNEPWDYTWDEWATLSEDAYDAMKDVNEDILIFVQGIAGGNRTNEVEPHGSLESNPNWGENFYGFHERPLNIPQDRLVISPHTYGPAVYQQMQFMDIENQPECEGLHGEEAAEQQCMMVMDKDRLEPGWEEHFGFLRDMGYALVVGEWGGNRGWPEIGTRDAEREMWGYLNTPSTTEENIDFQWQKAFASYMNDKGIQACYWGINPESSDTGGLYTHLADTDDAGWGTWTGLDMMKINMLRTDLWGLPATTANEIAPNPVFE